MSVEVAEHILHLKTPFQTIDIYDTPVFGKVLMLDGHIQLTEFDERAYHEALVHIPMFSLKAPKRALVVGGGDGGVLRELCRHDLERIDMVDIDAEVVESSRRYLPHLSEGAFDDHRVRLHIEDAFKFMKQVDEPYDLIVMDVTDVYEDEEGELSEQLFTADFHRDCKAALTDQGILVSQADNHVFCPYSLDELRGTFEEMFEETGSYFALVPSFGGYSAYCWASCNTEIQEDFPETTLPLHYLNPTTWALAFETLPFREV